MKLTKIRIKGLSTIDLPVRNASVNDQFIIKAADGLGPPEIDVYVAKTRDLGGFYKGRQPQYREPVFRIGLNPNYKNNVSVSDLRTTLYGLLTPNDSDEVQLILMENDDEVMYTIGYIKKFEIVPFNTVPEVQVTMSCLDTFFKGFHMIHAETVAGSQVDVLNEGSAETGLYFKLKFTQNVPWFIITDARGNSMNINFRFQVNDILTVDTRPGSREITVLRNGDLYNAIFALTMDSKWVYLYGGINRLRFNTTSFIWYDLSYIPQYWGI